MRKDFIQTEGDKFVRNGKPFMLRGWAFGSWMNLEHFMMGMPGTNSMILNAFSEVYGTAHAEEWLDSLLENMVSESDVRYLKSLGANSVRIPFGYHHLMDDGNPGVFSEKGFRRLDRAVKLCAENELYVILDLHSAPGGQNPDWHSDNRTGQAEFWDFRCFQDQVIWLWQELAKRYADNPWIAGYDLINEPGHTVSPEQIQNFYARATKAIRAVDADHILFLEGTDFGRDFTTLGELTDPQTALTVHFYPFVLEEDVLDPSMDDAHRMQIFAEIFEGQIKAAGAYHRPIWCGESGYEILDGQEAFIAELLDHNVRLCEERGISWNLWTYKDARRMGIVVPKKDSNWMRFRRRLEEHWSHDWEQRVSHELTDLIGEKYFDGLGDALAYDVDFRLRSILHRIAVEQILKPALRQIPWQEMSTYPRDFAFENCEIRTAVTDKIAHWL